MQHGLFRATSPGYQHAKGSCYVYGTTDPGVDTGIVIEGEGVLFIGRVALVEMGKVLGLLFPEDAEALLEESVRLETDNAYLQDENARLAEHVVALEADLAAIGRALRTAKED